MEDSKYNSQKMSKEQEQIIIFQDEQPPQETQKENIFVFQQEQAEEQEIEEGGGMSKRDFEECCSKLSQRIIFSNLKNFTQGVAKPTATFFQDARKQRRQSEKQRQIQRNIPKTKNERPSLFSQLPKDVRVEYLPQQNFSKRSLEESLGGEIQSKGMQGARFSSSSRPELRVEQQKDRNMLKVSNFRQFLYSQLQPGYQVSLRLKKVDSGLLSTTYKCYFAQNQQFVLSVQKSSLGGYVFSSSQVHISEEHISCLAKMECDFLGKQFKFYDAGEDCSKTKIMQHYKKQMAYISYAQEKEQPRKIQAIISTCDNALTDFTVIDKRAENILLERWSRGQQENTMQLCSRQPTYDSKDQTYKLDFLGLAGVASTKNFILEDEDHPEALIFGRQDKDSYLMQIKSPFSILQAVAVALSSVHYKFL